MADDPFPLVDGHSDPPLSSAGRDQSHAVARRLAGESFTNIFITPLRRTRETAQPLADSTGLAPTVVEELREVGLGTWESGEFERRAAAHDPLVGEIFAQQRWDLIPGSEPASRFAERVAAGLATVVEALEPDAACIAFVHGGVIAEVSSQLTKSRPFTFLFAENASVTRFVRLADGGWRLRTFNDVAHLDD
jgi:probable phosphoglycerate mutase